MDPKRTNAAADSVDDALDEQFLPDAKPARDRRGPESHRRSDLWGIGEAGAAQSAPRLLQERQNARAEAGLRCDTCESVATMSPVQQMSADNLDARQGDSVSALQELWGVENDAAPRSRPAYVNTVRAWGNDEQKEETAVHLAMQDSESPTDTQRRIKPAQGMYDRLSRFWRAPQAPEARGTRDKYAGGSGGSAGGGS